MRSRSAEAIRPPVFEVLVRSPRVDIAPEPADGLEMSNGCRIRDESCLDRPASRVSLPRHGETVAAAGRSGPVLATESERVRGRTAGWRRLTALAAAEGGQRGHRASPRAALKRHRRLVCRRHRAERQALEVRPCWSGHRPPAPGPSACTQRQGPESRSSPGRARPGRFDRAGFTESASRR